MISNCFKHKGLGFPFARGARRRSADVDANVPLTQEVVKQTKSLSKLTRVSALWQNIQEWIRREIVDDDPYDAEPLS